MGRNFFQSIFRGSKCSGGLVVRALDSSSRSLLYKYHYSQREGIMSVHSVVHLFLSFGIIFLLLLRLHILTKQNRNGLRMDPWGTPDEGRNGDTTFEEDTS